MSISMSIAVLLGAVVAGPGAGSGAGLAGHAALPMATPAEVVVSPADPGRDPVGAGPRAAARTGSTDWDDCLLRLRHMAGAPVQVARLADERPPRHR